MSRTRLQHFAARGFSATKFAKRWEKQMATPYSELTDEEKESDREQVRKYLPLIVGALSAKPE